MGSGNKIQIKAKHYQRIEKEFLNEKHEFCTLFFSRIHNYINMERSTLLTEERLMTQHNLNQPQSPPAPRLTRASIFSTAHTNRPNPNATINTIRYPPRIPRLRRPPQTFVSRATQGIATERPSSISSAVSMARNVRRESGSSIDPDTYSRIGSNSSSSNVEEDDAILNNSLYDLHCVSDEKAVDLAHVCNVDIQKVLSNTSYVPLEFGVVSEDGGQYSSTYSVHNILKNDGTVYWYVVYRGDA